ncbi:MAG: DUF4249 family protein, partial [Bacteroidota bacterium]
FTYTPLDSGPGDPLAESLPQATYRSARGLTPRLGPTYRLEVSAPDLPLATAEVTLPDPPEASVVDDKWERYDPAGSSERRVEVALDDPAGPDVYELAIVVRRPSPDGSGFLYNDVGFGSLFPALRQGYELLDIDVAIDPELFYWGGAVFNDDLFSGRQQTFDMTFDVGSFAFDPSLGLEYSVLLIRVSEAFAKHELRRAQQEVNIDNPFAEPSPLYSNVEGGHGVVGGITPLRLPLPTDLPPPGASGGSLP